MLVGDRQGQLAVQGPGRGVDGRGVGELRKGEEANVPEGTVALDGHVDHLEHAGRVGRDAGAVHRVGLIDLAGGGGVAKPRPLIHAGRIGHGQAVTASVRLVFHRLRRSLLRTWINSATTLTAISSGVSAPMSRPTGE